MPYNFAAESFHTKKLCSRLSSRKVQFSVRKTKKIVVIEAPFEGLGVTYAVHLRFIGTDGQTDGRTDGHLCDKKYRVAYNAAR